MGDPHFHNDLWELARRDGVGVADSGTSFGSDDGGNTLFAPRSGRSHRKTMPMLSGARAVRSAREGSPFLAILTLVFLGACIAAYVTHSGTAGFVLARGLGAGGPMQDVDFPVGTILLVAPR